MGKHRRTRQRITSRFNPQIEKEFDKKDSALETVFRIVRDRLAWSRLLESVPEEQRDLLIKPVEYVRNKREQK